LYGRDVRFDDVLCFARLFAFRVIRAWRITPLKSMAHIAPLLRALGIGGFRGRRRNSLSSSSLRTVHQIVQGGLQIANHRLAG
jgi:hypothetical protein